jgi:hypothetical protein
VLDALAVIAEWLQSPTAGLSGRSMTNGCNPATGPVGKCYRRAGGGPTMPLAGGSPMTERRRAGHQAWRRNWMNAGRGIAHSERLFSGLSSRH